MQTHDPHDVRKEASGRDMFEALERPSNVSSYNSAGR
jgi:hypothetical protein